MRILLAPLGSEGDVNPFLWLATGLQARGHEPELLISPNYGWLADARGLKWSGVGDPEDFVKFARHPNLWHPLRGTEFVIRQTLELLPAVQAAFEKLPDDFDLVLTSTMGMAASFLAEARGIPRISLHLQPICARSVHAMPLFLNGLEWLTAAPPLAKRAFFGLVDAHLNRLMRKPVNAFRATLGLSPIRDAYTEVLMAGDRRAGLFPEWFAPPQPDWPENFRLFGFPLEPPPPPVPLTPRLEAFLAAGKPPILWCHGSANFEMHHFQACAVAASRELGERCVLVSLEPPRLELPEFAIHISHVQFDALFPRCRAVVNHGGIGTMSKAMQAGVPQLLVPMAHDQPDNAARAIRLGIGTSVPLRQLTPARAAQALRKLLSSPGIIDRCHEVRARILPVDPRSALIEWIEQPFRRSSPPDPSGLPAGPMA